MTHEGEARAARLGLFAATGIEIEYMIVDRERLSVLPVCDELIRAAVGRVESEIERGALAWSNELVLHVVELKTNGPARTLDGLASVFAADVRRIDDLLAPLGGRLMPTAMHPLMNPDRETVLWPHDYSEVYQTFDRIFDCRGHGWSNLQSVHINLPFGDDQEFGRLHAAIRLVLPLLPFLAASSPLVEGRFTGLADNRLEYYRMNCRRIPSITAHVVPEQVFSQADYEARIFRPIAEAVAPFDADGVLDPEWTNARGAIARFDRSAIEIRLLDVQECPRADLAVVSVIVALVRALVEERWAPGARQRALDERRLEAVLLAGIAGGSAATVDDGDLATLVGAGARGPVDGRALWGAIAERLVAEGLLAGSGEWAAPFERFLSEGTLAERIERAIGAPSPGRIFEVYGSLSECLHHGTLFSAP
ncbi:MAG: glutamate-cysteine ligase family protein [Sorangiineae bacterium]|nr:glutamate-cysteine ligase family protein [Polyangiaceae bacterium]MEB2323477.1 glutamate-cysteine ligase family protein [Sorangiineae bacterium]